jgi:hypothetical protein
VSPEKCNDSNICYLKKATVNCKFYIMKSGQQRKDGVFMAE